MVNFSFLDLLVFGFACLKCPRRLGASEGNEAWNCPDKKVGSLLALTQAPGGFRLATASLMLNLEAAVWRTRKKGGIKNRSGHGCPGMWRLEVKIFGELAACSAKLLS